MSTGSALSGCLLLHADQTDQAAVQAQKECGAWVLCKGFGCAGCFCSC